MIDSRAEVRETSAGERGRLGWASMFGCSLQLAGLGAPGRQSAGASGFELLFFRSFPLPI
jgi:hypothetical protein